MSGTSPEAILYDSAGNLLAVQNGSAIPASTPGLLFMGSDGTNSRYITVDSSGRPVMVGAGTAGTPTGGVISIQGVAGGTVVPISITGTNTISGTVTANQGTANSIGNSWPVEITDGTNILGTAAHPVRIDPTGTTTQPVSGTVTANAGTGNFAVVQATAANLNATVIGTVTSNIGTTGGLALDTTLAKLTIAQGASLGTNTQALIGGSVTTVSPTYTTGQISPISLTTAGAIRVDGSGVTQPVSGTVTANAGTGNFTVVQPTAANLNATVVGAVTANIGTTNGLALDATLTGGAQTTRITDGTNTATVKPASTAAVASDKALVVAVSPNNSVAVTQQSDIMPATQNITTQDVGSTTTTGANNQVIITGSPTANSTASFTLSTQEAVQIQVTGTWTGSLQAEISVDGGTTWYLRKLHQSGGGVSQTSFYTGNFLAGANVTGLTNIRIRAISAMTGTATVKISESINTNVVITQSSQPVEVYPSVYHSDAFGRFRVSQSVRQWSSMSEYTDYPGLWETQTVGTGSVTWQQFLSSNRLSTGGTANNASAIRQTRRYMRYQPGKSALALMTFVMGAAQTNVKTHIGLYDGYNGLFFQRDGTAFNIVRRTNVTGTPVDNIVAQSNWNLDKLDGTGDSGITLDVTKVQILVIEYQWLGAGTARLGFDFGGNIGVVFAHQFANANNLSTIYMSSGSLPFRGHVFNTGTASGTATLDMICTAYSNEGAPHGRTDTDTDRVSLINVSNGTNLVNLSTTLIPIMSIRAATQYGGTGSGGAPNRGWIVPLNAEFYGSSIDFYWEIWIGASLTGASFAPVSPNSIADIDTSATAINTTNAVRVASGYISSSKSGAGSSQAVTPFDIPIICSGLLNSQDTGTIAAVSLNTGSNKVGVSLSWEERY